jgi:hypothetical protein
MFAALSAGTVGVGLLLLDERVKESVQRTVHEGLPTGRIAAMGHEAQQMALDFAQMVRDESIAHMPLAMFAVVALLLFLVMMRV